MITGAIGEIEPPELETVAADCTLEEAVEVMLDNNYSQMGLERDERLIGMISFQSIARAMMVTDQICNFKHDFADQAAELAVEQPIWEDEGDDINELFALLRSHPYVVVTGESDRYRIITDYDIREFYLEFIEPFALLGEVETAIRSVIRTVFEGDVTAAIDEMAEDHREFQRIDSLEQCGFYHYSLLISVQWKQQFSEFFNHERNLVYSLIEKSAQERNRLFHFRIDDRDELDLDIIRLAHAYFTSFDKPNEKRPLVG